jgi:hypothetical protein
MPSLFRRNSPGRGLELSEISEPGSGSDTGSVADRFGARPMTEVSSMESFKGTLARFVSSETSVVMNCPTWNLVLSSFARG